MQIIKKKPCEDTEAEFFEEMFMPTMPEQPLQGSEGQGRACRQTEPPQPQATLSQQLQPRPGDRQGSQFAKFIAAQG